MSLKKSVAHGALSCVALTERILRTPARVEEIQNFLLLQYPTALGTAVHATPLVRALMDARPSATIVVAASSFAQPLFEYNPSVHRVIHTPSPLLDLRGAARSLRSARPFGGQPFLAITSVGNERSRIALAATMSGASRRMGFTEAPELYETVLRLDPQRSLIDNNLRIAEIFTHESCHYEPEVYFQDETAAWAKRALREAGVRDGQIVVVFVTQTSVTQRKGWRKERFQAAARHMIDRYGAHIVFVGTETERSAIEAIREGIDAATSNFAGKTNLLQLSALLSLCRVGLTLDTGILHLGRAVGLPMAIIAPAWSPPIEWLPVGNPRYRILKNANLAACPPDYIIDEVSAGEAVAALDELVVAYPEGAKSTRI